MNTTRTNTAQPITRGLRAAGWVALFVLLATAGRAAPPRQVLHGHVPAVVARLASVDRLAGTQRLDLAIGLPLRNREALTNLLQQIYDPASPNYRQYLTPAQFAERFGPSEEDYQTLIDFAEANGLTVSATHPNRVLVEVSGPVADIETAFHVNLRLYPHPTEARTFYAPDVEPSIDLAVPVLDVSGLDNYIVPHPMNLKRKLPNQPVKVTPYGGSGPNGTLMGRDFRTAYAPGVSLTGTGQAVGLLEFDGYYASDITAYESQAGLPNVPLQNVLLGAFNGSPGSANGEVALDIEMVIAMAPGLARVIVYEGSQGASPNSILNRMATDNLAKQLSSSWGWTAGASATLDQIFQQFAAQGQSYFNASGDTGAFVGTVDAPADDPYITSVGGTTLTTTGPVGAWVSETTWNWNVTGGGTSSSGGGISPTYAIPSWQQGISMSANQGSTTRRNFPDVAMAADDIWVISDNGQSGAVGGTSCAAPLWAAFTALVNQQAAAAGRPAVGFLNPAVYAIGKEASYTSCFHDITTGNNTTSTSPSKYFAVASFDLCTGWGSPRGSSLINALAPLVNAPVLVTNGYSVAAESCTPANGAIDPGETVTVILTLRNTGGLRTTNLVATLQPSSGVLAPGGPQTYGALAAGGGAASHPFTFTANGACGDTLSATLQLRDGAKDLGTVSFALPLGKIVTAPTLTENFDEVTAPDLPSGWTAAVVSGVETDWVTANDAPDTAPNAAFALDVATAGVNALVSPIIPIVSPSAQLTFRNNYTLEARTRRGSTTYYDGGVLEIAIGSAGFTDILAAGGSFVAGGYNGTITTTSDNPLAGRQAWGGSSGTWITTKVNLPAAAAGQNIQLRWGCATDSGNNYGGTGWYVDGVSIQDGYYACCTDTADLAVSQSISPIPLIAGQNLGYSITVTNAGPNLASSATVTDALPAGFAFVSASPGCVYDAGTVVCSIDTLPAGGTTSITITVMPTTGGSFTNAVSVASVTPDPNPGDNTSVLSNTLDSDAPVVLAVQPSRAAVVPGSLVSFQVLALGAAPLSYQWFFNGTNLMAGATNDTLTLSGVQPDQAGTYTVVVTNDVGPAASGMATLAMLVPPLLTASSTSLSGTQFSLSLLSFIGLRYTLESATSLTDPKWTALLPAVPGTGDIIVLQDTNALPSPGSRFYRVRCD